MLPGTIKSKNKRNALKGDGEALKGEGNTLPSHLHDFCLRPLCRAFSSTPLRCN